MKHGIGWFLVIVGLITLGIFVFILTSYRFKNETLTETQLAIWSLQRWWAWIPATVVAGAGLWIVGQPRKDRASIER